MREIGRQGCQRETENTSLTHNKQQTRVGLSNFCIDKLEEEEKKKGQHSKKDWDKPVQGRVGSDSCLRLCKAQGSLCPDTASGIEPPVICCFNDKLCVIIVAMNVITTIIISIMTIIIS